MASQRRIAITVGAVVLLLGAGFVAGAAWSGTDDDGSTRAEPDVEESEFVENPFAASPACVDVESVADDDWYTFGPEPLRSVSYRMLVEEQVEAGEVERWVLDEMDDDQMAFMHNIELLEFGLDGLALSAGQGSENLELRDFTLLLPASSLDDESRERSDIDLLVAPADAMSWKVENLMDGKLEASTVLLATTGGELEPTVACTDRGSDELWERFNADAGGVPMTPDEIGDRLEELPVLHATMRDERAPLPWEERDPSDRSLFEEDAVPLEVRQQVRGIEVRVSAAALSKAGLSEGQFCSRQPIAEGGLCSHIDPEYSEVRFDVSAYRPEPVTILHLTGDFESELRGEEVTETEVAEIPVGDYPNGVDLVLVDGEWMAQPGAA